MYATVSYNNKKREFQLFIKWKRIHDFIDLVVVAVDHQVFGSAVVRLLHRRPN